MKKRYTRTFSIALALIIIIGLASGKIKLQWGSVALPTAQIKPTEIIQQLQNIQNITGEFMIFP
jgi:hypothetical protein